MNIFQKSQKGRYNKSQFIAVEESIATDGLPVDLLREKEPVLPALSELEVVRHFTGLSAKNFSIDTHFYPLGSCTMKYNPRGVNRVAMLPNFLNQHPLVPTEYCQGTLAIFYQLQNFLKSLTGMSAVALTPMAGAQGEFAGISMIKAYHANRSDFDRIEIIVPSAAHGTNPATATMCGYTVREVAIDSEGDIDIDSLRSVVGPYTAGLMMTNPSTCGVFERNIKLVSEIVHEAGGLLYYDGANLNAIMGIVSPGDMGFDVLHLNLHKTFATPHGGGGPGAGPVAVNEKLIPFLPVPLVTQSIDNGKAFYHVVGKNEKPLSIGRLTTFYGNSNILIRAFAYALFLGRDGMRRVAQYATLNANYLARSLESKGMTLAYPTRYATHECIVTFKEYAKSTGISAMDIAKRLLDFGVHAPTTYFPLLVPECFLIEPTETESKQVIDDFVSILEKILQEGVDNPDQVKSSPHTLPVNRLNDTFAVKHLDIKHI